MSNSARIDGRGRDTRLRRWLIARRERQMAKRLRGSTLMRLQGDWDPTPQQYLAARARETRRSWARRPAGLIVLSISGLALALAAMLATMAALPSHGRGVANGPQRTQPHCLISLLGLCI